MDFYVSNKHMNCEFEFDISCSHARGFGDLFPEKNLK